MFVRSCFQDNAESVHSYSNLNELLFDTDERGRTLHTPRNEGGFVVEEKETIAVESFFTNVLSDSSHKNKTRRQSRAERRAGEPLL